MKKTTKVIIAILLAIICSVFGYSFKGTLGAFLGFLAPLLVIGLFYIWRKYRGEDE